MVNVLVICPYNLSMLKAISNSLAAKMVDITIVGAKRRIMELCYIYSIQNRFFEIINAENDIDVCFEANELIKNRNFDAIVYGYLSVEFHKNIVVGDVAINIIDIPKVRHLVFAPINTEESFISFDEKIDAIIKAKELMQILKINHCNIGLVEDKTSKTALIERNVIHLHPELNNDVINIIGIREVYEDSYNIVIFNSKNALDIFLDTVLIDLNSKNACIKKASDIYIIDAYDMDSKDIFFSLFLISKLCVKAEAC